ncbi:hypothetical protein [Bacillus sp. AFS040349]|uniref:hypothetical protein n=1 Tax=Bacillus sp. AFS040349 TaxID=2033502 RepID=UPI000BFD03F6|nr:hypothetical protein [Bacillus sp. AFS040349]PGT82206.1 hypothetical protein COD11_15535 [Bacillus sp. AFS040349]
METTITKKDAYSYTEQKLKAHFQNNSEFNASFAVMFDFYRKKFSHIIEEKNKSTFEDRLFTSAKGQYFNGYFMIREMLSHEETQIQNEWLAQPEGIITEEIPQLIKNITGSNFDEVILTEPMQQFTMWAITQYEDILAALNQLAFDIVCLGAKQAILDERDTRGLSEHKSSLEGLLGGVDRATFITPQHFLTCDVKTSETEIWTLSWWSALDKLDNKAGEVTIVRIIQENESRYALNVYLSSQVPEHERNLILEQTLTSLMERNEIAREDVTVNFAVVSDFYIFVQD